ncbi:hypothetical protein GA0115260_100072 [Streptomyces sp. MnatMP-M27]|nr:hypothetical protein GA0115260_100072 [Streptomyces sp. MnatMP-M27]
MIICTLGTLFCTRFRLGVSAPLLHTREAIIMRLKYTPGAHLPVPLLAGMVAVGALLSPTSRLFR